jgi:hypothetical protein
MSFRLLKSELLERKQRWIRNVLEKQKLTSLDIACLSGEIGRSLFRTRS